MLNPLRFWTAAGLVSAATALPFATTVGDSKIDDTIRQAKVAICQDILNSCTTQCSNTASAAPGSYQFCMQDCTRNYQNCMSQISRGAAVSGTTGVTSHPSIAPPTPTPRKISPERVPGVGSRTGGITTKAGATATPKSGSQQLPPDKQREVARDTVRTSSRPTSAKTSPTPSPTKK